MKSKNLFILIPLILLTSCNFVVEPIPSYTDTIAISDIDGSNLRSLCEHKGEIPYFIPNLANPGEELILLDCTVRIDVMNLDGTERHTIIDSLGGIANFSADRSKMLLNKNGEIYLANVDGTDLVNLTNTPSIYEAYPAFSPKGTEVVYSYIDVNSGAYLVSYNILMQTKYIIYGGDNKQLRDISFAYINYEDENNILFRTTPFYEENSDNYYEVWRININTGSLSPVLESFECYYFFYNINNNISVVNNGSSTILVANENSIIIHEFTQGLDISNDTRRPFSSNGDYVTVENCTYDRLNDIEYIISSENNDFNQNNTKLVGIANRYYD